MGSMSQSGSHGTGRHQGGSPPGAPGGPPHLVPGEPAGRPGQRRVVVVVVDGSPESGPALRQAASQARQRNALLDIVCIVPDGTDGPASILARVKLGNSPGANARTAWGSRYGCGWSTVIRSGAAGDRGRSRTGDQWATQAGRG